MGARKFSVLVLVAALVLVVVLPQEVTAQDDEDYDFWDYWSYWFSCVDDDDQWTCGSGETICREYLCDDWDDCDDGSDEVLETCLAAECYEGTPECVGNRENGTMPVCAPLWALCDRDNFCPNGEDETQQLCDWVVCPREDQFSCEDNANTCIERQQVCDTLWDCPRGQDEDDCDIAECTEDEFECHSGQCIPAENRCDGNEDCLDGFDERIDMCDPTCPEGDYFECSSDGTGLCISHDKVCDEVDDCHDGSDEGEICEQEPVNECEQPDNDCERNCVDTRFGYYCTCPHGHRLLQDRRHCERLDACMQHPITCTQLCTDAGNGEVTCSCDPGYTLEDGITCRVDSDVEPELIFANHYYIRNMSLDGNMYNNTPHRGVVVHVMDIDTVDNMVYFYDLTYHNLKRASLHSNDLETINFHNGLGAEGMAVDWVGRKLYYTSLYIKGIYVSNLNGTYTIPLVEGTSPYPRGIAVYPQKGLLWWTDWGTFPFIKRMAMDGSDIQEVITDGLYWPNGIAIDYVTDRMWWCDAQLDRIEYADLDGNNRHVVLEHVAHPFSITFYEEYIYWSDWNMRQVERANRFTGEDRSVLTETLQMPYSLHINHPSKQPRWTSPCGTDNGGCSHHCLLSPVDPFYSCKCPDGFVLDIDGKNCLPNCSPAQFQCDHGDHKCIPKIWYCDTIPDCKNSEDEPDSCPKRDCPVSQFECDEDNCIHASGLCDTRPDCSDGTDEDPDYCNNVECLPLQWRCNSGQCISQGDKCDGMYHCRDASDEYDCGFRNGSCNHDEFKCDNGLCIPSTYRCDLDNDCGDMSDEPFDECWDESKRCPEGWFTCKHTYKCVPGTITCDGYNDCLDFSDESDEACPSCKTDEFACSDGSCKPLRWKCDFIKHCRYGDDEEDCEGQYRNCSESEFRCKNNQCVRGSYRCDNTEDCIDGSDEEGCESYQDCKDNQFKCGDGSCIHLRKKCDGNKDCHNATDEIDCEAGQCKASKWECPTHVCIDPETKCDLLDDCGNGYDESEEFCREFECPEATHFRCQNGICMVSWRKCDGHIDCEDGSDEDDQLCNCEFKCTGDKACLFHEDICDGFIDCDDMSDELGCKDGLCDETQSGCLQNCTNHDDAHSCVCYHGYTPDPDNPSSCIDVNECGLFMSHCPQLCQNVNGSHSCTCLDGYMDVMPGTGRVCEPIDDEGEVHEGKLIIADRTEIRTLDLDTKEYTSFVMTAKSVKGVDFDPKSKLVYYTDVGADKILRARLPDDAGVLSYDQDLEIDVKKPEGIAVDWLARNLYFTDRGEGLIAVTNLDGHFRRNIIHLTSKFKPSDIVLSPTTAMMYFINDYHTKKRLESAWMDGGRHKPIVEDLLIEPMGLAIDHHMNDRLFWTDFRRGTIESVNADGSDRVTVLFTGMPHRLDVFASRLFFTARDVERLFETGKFGRYELGVDKEIKVLVSALAEGSGIRMVHPKRHNMHADNPCEDNECDALCVLNPAGARCLCPQDAIVIPSDLGGESRCQMSTPPVRQQPVVCSCSNNGVCEVAQNGKTLHCVCPKGFTGHLCEIIVTTTTITPPTTTTVPTTTTTPTETPKKKKVPTATLR